jgi:hypothetical protein
MRFLRKRHDGERGEGVDADTPVCEHVALIPTWDTADKVGRNDEASMFTCEACGVEFTPSQASYLHATEAARVRRRIAS